MTRATTTLPAHYRRQAALDLAKDARMLAGAIALGAVLLVATGWLSHRLIGLLRPSTLDGLRLRDLLAATDGGVALQVSFGVLVAVVVAGVLILPLHELAHGAAYWWLTRIRPTGGIHGLLPYVAAPPGVYSPRNLYLAVGLAPLLLTPLALLLALVLPPAAAPCLLLLASFNMAGAAGDLLMVVRLLPYPPDTLLQDDGTGTVVYRPVRAEEGR